MPEVPTKICSVCDETKPATAFGLRADSIDGRRSSCKVCTAKLEKDRYTARAAARVASDYDAMKPDDFDVSIANDGRHDPKASQEKRQEFSKSMGEFADGLNAAAIEASHGRGDVADNMPPASGTYIAKVAEQERRFQNRRLARSMSLFAANESLALRQSVDAMQKYLHDKITATGYAKRAPSARCKRSVVLFLSDLHLGADLSVLDEPVPFRAVEESRRLEFIMRQAIDYKPQYRKDSELLLIMGGDMIEGQLGHDFRGGCPLAEQKAIFWRHFRVFMAHVAAAFPSVRVVCQSGNHGRDKVRHPGRATARKWDGHEFELYFGLREMCAGLANVTFQIDFRAVSIVDVHGVNLGVTHSDTDVKIGHPDSCAARNGAELDRINSTRIHGVEFAAWVFGHWHTPRYHPRRPLALYNGALVPPNGYARGAGYIGEPCGQWIFESVEGHPIGDLRFLEVGRAQDVDERLGTIIKPFRFE